MATKEPLLKTKIQVPDLTGSVINRPHLLQRLDQGISQHRMTLLSAQAGHGKTTLLSQWADQTDMDVAWLSLDEDDDEFNTFMRYVMAAWQWVDPEVVDSDFSLVAGSQGVEAKAISVQLLNTLQARQQPICFVLDDYHLIQEEAIHEAISYWVEHAPTNLRLVISSRHQPPIPLHRFRARNYLCELEATDLQLSRQQALRFLQERLDVNIEEEAVNDLYAAFNGWVGGFQLAALEMSSKGEPLAAMAPPETGQKYLWDYLAKEVLERQPPDLQDFLLRTSLLQQLCPALCDFMLSREDSHQTLLEIFDRNLFIQPLDSQGVWYRYHHLFAEFLRERLKRQHPQAEWELHRKAAQWHLENDNEERAFRHAVAGGKSSQVLEVCERFVPLKLSRGEIRRTEEWLSAIPAPWFKRHPTLVLGRAAFNAMRGDFQAAMRDLKTTEARLGQAEGDEAQKAKARLTAFYCSTACMQNDLETAQTYGQKAARELAPNDVFYHAMIHGSMGDAYRADGQWEQARNHYQQALRRSKGTDFQFMGIHAYGGLADMCLRQGKLEEAADLWNKALKISQQPNSWGAIPLPVVGWAYIRLAEIKYEWNQLEAAESDVRAGLKRAELGGDPRAMLAGELLRGYLSLAKGDHEDAESALQAAKLMVEQSQFPDWVHRYKRLRIDFWLAIGDLEAANRWLTRQQVDLEAEIQPGQEPLYLGVARLLLARGAQSATNNALSILSKLEAKARSLGTLGFELQSQALLALAYWQSRREPEAFTWLEKALRSARAEGFTRSLIDLGRPFARLLQAAAKREAMPDLLYKLLDEFDEELKMSSAAPELTEPLTDRELEVLALMAAGLTNKEIAEKLVIAPGTVKKHAGNIYGKLNVNSRTAAAAKARELALLE